MSVPLSRHAAFSAQWQGFSIATHEALSQPDITPKAFLETLLQIRKLVLAALHMQTKRLAELCVRKSSVLAKVSTTSTSSVCRTPDTNVVQNMPVYQEIGEKCDDGKSKENYLETLQNSATELADASLPFDLRISSPSPLQCALIELERIRVQIESATESENFHPAANLSGTTKIMAELRDAVSSALNLSLGANEHRSTVFQVRGLRK